MGSFNSSLLPFITANFLLFCPESTAFAFQLSPLIINNHVRIQSRSSNLQCFVLPSIRKNRRLESPKNANSLYSSSDVQNKVILFGTETPASSSGSSSSSTPSSSRSNSALESAIPVEWDRVSEFERRVAQGVEYEHWPEWGWDGGGRRVRRGGDAEEESSGNEDEDGVERVRAVFCGVRGTEEERNRLKCAEADNMEECTYYI